MSIQQIEQDLQLNARSRSGRAISLDISSSSPEGGELEQVVAYCRSITSASIPEEILGFGRKLPTDCEGRKAHPSGESLG